MKVRVVGTPAGEQLRFERDGVEGSSNAFASDAPRAAFSFDTGEPVCGSLCDLLVHSSEAATAPISKAAGDVTKLVARRPLVAQARVLMAGSRRFAEDPHGTPVAAMLKYPGAFAEPGEMVRLPDFSDAWDVDAAIGAIIGRNLFRASAEEAAAAIVGYSLIADVTDRARFTEEARTNNGLMAKNHKGLSGIGPCIWLPDARDATPGRATLRLDGVVQQSFHLTDLVWCAGEVAAWWSAARLVPGDMIGLGPAILRGGHARIPPVRISGSERIEISCEEVGVLELRIADRSTV